MGTISKIYLSLFIIVVTFFTVAYLVFRSLGGDLIF